ncbi:hypothetical protein QBC39DRAFT_86283 [Podospora conica]|nr:hypothetical protein QBC39DRAFT_86283 [Schizothecium conicum]
MADARICRGVEPLSASLPPLPTTKASLAYIKPLDRYDHEIPYRWRGPLDKAHSLLRSNIELETVDIPVRDVSGIVQPECQRLSLARNGFEIAPYSGVEDSALSVPEQLETYLEEITDVVKMRTVGDLAVCFNFAFRKCHGHMLGNPELSLQSEDPRGSFSSPNTPGFQVHSDYTQDFAKSLIGQFLTTDEAEEYLTDRYRRWIVNAWKPLHKTVENAPLAFCDPSTVSPVDALEVDLPSLTGMTRTTYYKYNPQQEWYWCRSQTPTQVSLFKSWDSDHEEGSWPAVPHAALRFPEDQFDDTVLRESIESRILVAIRKE